MTVSRRASPITRRRLGVLSAAAAFLLLLSGAPQGSAAGFSSSNVEYLKTWPVEAGAPTSARLLGKHLFVGGSKSFSIYDVSDPINPQLLSITPTGFSFPNEDIDTNGRILLMNDETLDQGLQIYDVEDRAAPRRLAALPDLPDHTFSCVLDCRWAYGSRGTIVDLKNPAEPKVAGNWGASPPSDGFDVTEVSPGLVLTSTRTLRLLDARKEPTKPRLLASGSTPDNRLLHSNRWPNRGRDRFILVQGETPLSRSCGEGSGAFMTWRGAGYRRSRTFELTGEFRVKNGNLVDGDPPANVLGCTNMWFDEHPSFRNGGLVASAFFEHGVRFLEVDRSGGIEQVGYFTPLGGEAISAIWVTRDIVYSVDLSRGLDILRFDGG